jgi:hypothetical protein
MNNTIQTSEITFPSAGTDTSTMLSVIPRLLVLKYDFLPIGVLGIILSAMPKPNKLKDYEVINFLLKLSTFFMSVLGILCWLVPRLRSITSVRNGEEYFSVGWNIFI